MKKFIVFILCLISQITLGISGHNKLQTPYTSPERYESGQIRHDSSQDGLKLSIYNDTKNTITIEKIKAYQTANAYILLESTTRITPGETLTIGVNIREFNINDGKSTYKIIIPSSDMTEEITLPVGIMRLQALGMKIQQVRN